MCDLSKETLFLVLRLDRTLLANRLKTFSTYWKPDVETGNTRFSQQRETDEIKPQQSIAVVRN